MAVLSVGTILHNVCEERGHALIVQDPQPPPVEVPGEPWLKHRRNRRHSKEAVQCTPINQYHGVSGLSSLSSHAGYKVPRFPNMGWG